MATQAEINKLWAEQLAQAGGTKDSAETLRKQGLALGLTPEQLNAAEESAFQANIKPGSYASRGNLGLSSPTAPTSPTPTATGGSPFNPNDPAHVQGAKDLAAGMSQMISAGNEGGARQLYNQKKAQLGFSDADFAPFSGFSEKQVGDWSKSSAISPTQATATSAANTGTAAQAAPTTQAASEGYKASNVDIAGNYRNLGLSDPTSANARLLSGAVNNPYLDAQADNITKRLNKNLQENIMPGIGQGAQIAGQYGGSRQGIAQGKAIGETQDNLANALTNMYSSANEAAQGRMAQAAGNLSGIGASAATSNAGFQNQASQFGANAANTSNQFNAGQANQASQFNTGQQNQNNQFNTGQSNSYNLGLMGNQLQAQSIGNAYDLGKGNLANAQQGTANQYALGQGQLGVSQGNLALGNRQADQSYTLGQGNLALGNRQADNSYALGQGQLANQGQANQNSYNLGLASNQLGYANLDQGNQQFGANYGLNAMNAQTNWAKTQADIANQMYQQPIANFNNFTGNANQIAGQGGQTSQTNPGSPYVGALGGYQLATKFF